MIEPMKAVVRPRVYVGADRGSALLEDLVVEYASSNTVLAIDLCGSPGAGITTALQHIAFLFGDSP